MKKRGFTLIELLAVIVILAIIALIATPAVLNIIEDSEKSAAERSTEAVIKAGELYYMTSITHGNPITGEVDATILNVKNKPSSGTINISITESGNVVTVTANDLIFKGYSCDFVSRKANCTNIKK